LICSVVIFKFRREETIHICFPVALSDLKKKSDIGFSKNKPTLIVSVSINIVGKIQAGNPREPTYRKKRKTTSTTTVLSDRSSKQQHATAHHRSPLLAAATTPLCQPSTPRTSNTKKLT
jgi:hypothetical protein